MDFSLLGPFRDYGGFALALALGLLIGLQRGWVLRDQAAGSRFAGFRTYGLLGLAGGLGGFLSTRAQGPATIVLAASAALVVAGYWRSSQRNPSISGTASLSGLITMACGFLAATDYELLATAAASVMVLLLALRTQLHGWVGRLDEKEVMAVARFALIALVILPMLPDRPYGPYDTWNPRQLWLVVVLVSGFSFAGYIAARRLGATRGIIATAAAGSAVSSTAVTASIAQRMRESETALPIHGAAILAASSVMFARVLVLTALLAPFALPMLARLVAPGLLASLLATGWFLMRSRDGGVATDGSSKVRNPFDLGPALVLMGLVMVLTLIARFVLDRFGDAGLALVLAITGTVDVDSAIITMGTLPPGTLDAKIAGLVLLPPIVLNTLFKAGATLSIAGWQRGRNAALALAAAALASTAAVPVFF